MEKEEIFSLLEEWFSKGYFTTTTKIKSESKDYSNNVIEKRCVKRQMSYTSMSKVLFVGDRTGSPVFQAFQRYCDEKRIMTPLEAKVHLNLPSLYKLHKAVSDGVLLRFERDDVIIYVA